MEPAVMLQHTALPLAWNGWLKQHARAYLLPTDAKQDVATGPRYDLMFMAMNAAVAGSGIALLPEFLGAPLVTSRRLSKLSSATWKAPGGYYLSKSPLLRSDTAFIMFRDWLRNESNSHEKR
jgi:LysR family transcriptional regulator, glycine cleavage system transcriptional activator